MIRGMSVGEREYWRVQISTVREEKAGREINGTIAKKL